MTAKLYGFFVVLLAAQLGSAAEPQTESPASAAPSAAPSAASVPEPAAVGSIDQEHLLQQMQTSAAQLLILDVRTPDEYSAGHIEGAVNIAYDQLPQRLTELEAAKDKQVVVYCRSGRRAGLALETLRANGFQNLAHLDGDMLAWEAAKRPLIANATPVQDGPTEAPPPQR